VAVTSRERLGAAGIMWKIDSEWTNVAGAPLLTAESRDSRRRAIKTGRSAGKEVLRRDVWG
jgi:hypothetical protein